MERQNLPKLSQFIKSELSISVSEFARLEDTPERTLRNRWIAKRGNRSIRDAVLRHKVGRL